VIDVGDEELRRHFGALRDVDRASMPPSFADLTRRPPTSVRARRTAARWVLAGGAGAMAAAAMLAVLSHRRQEEAWLSAAAEISRWQAPSDVLLDDSHGALLSGSRVLGASVLDSIIPPSHEE
jgi:hypothetical protein